MEFRSKFVALIFFALKKILFFVTIFLSIFSNAQMDVEHWFAPMGNNFPAPTTNDYYQSIYLSTKETVPFDVEIYSGNTLIGKKTISKGSPESFEIPRQYIITDDAGDRMRVLNMGLHLIGTKKYFANLRFSVKNHAEIVTSKGLGGLGETFYLGMPEVNLGSKPAVSNHTASVIATENSTTVTLSGYNSSLIFTNDSAPLSATKTVVLNKGESYIFEINNSSTQNFKKGLIGAKIQSDKPISVSTGTFSGRIADTGVDIFMDQSMPASKTGREFIVMNGNGDLSLSPPSIMENTLIIATEPNTEIFLNNNTTSTPDFTLANPGDYIFVDSRYYFPLEATSNIYGLYVRTSKNAYVYEFLAGSSANELASGGMNLIPALSCFLPSKIDELSKVDENEVEDTSGHVVNHKDVKLNIIAQKGSDIYVNDSKTNLKGPFPVLGTSDWELYSLPNVEDNITVESKNGTAITAGIAGGSSNVGFGGYFAGFSSIPAIAKIGDCAKGQELVVDDIYDLYEWTYSPDNSPGSYIPYSGATYFITPGRKFGYYKCKVTKYSCLPFRETKEFKYLKCTEFNAATPATIGNCGSIIPIKPVFKKDPSIAVDISKTFILEHPADGNAYVDAAGNVHFDADNTNLDQVTFKYYFESFGTFSDTEIVTVTVNIAQIKLTNVEDVQCVDFDGEGKYNLKNDFEPINTDPTFVKYQYYSDSALRNEITGAKIENYPSKPDTKVYVVVTNSYGCDNSSKPAEITLKTFELPIINTIDVKGETSVVVNATKGKGPYLYYIKKDGDVKYLPAFSEYSSSNVLPIKEGKGIYTVYIKSADNCNPVTQIFAVVGISNVITPNDDGKNDVIDMSMLSYKLNPTFQVFDRNGRKVFEGNKLNNFKWTGKVEGKPLPTTTYWYLLQWQDFDGAEPDIQTGWILLKNRNSD